MIHIHHIRIEAPFVRSFHLGFAASGTPRGQHHAGSEPTLERRYNNEKGYSWYANTMTCYLPSQNRLMCGQTPASWYKSTRPRETHNGSVVINVPQPKRIFIYLVVVFAMRPNGINPNNHAACHAIAADYYLH